jgi:hypothetical protein
MFDPPVVYPSHHAPLGPRSEAEGLQRPWDRARGQARFPVMSTQIGPNAQKFLNGVMGPLEAEPDPCLAPGATLVPANDRPGSHAVLWPVRCRQRRVKRAVDQTRLPTYAHRCGRAVRRLTPQYCRRGIRPEPPVQRQAVRLRPRRRVPRGGRWPARLGIFWLAATSQAGATRWPIRTRS